MSKKTETPEEFEKKRIKHLEEALKKIKEHKIVIKDHLWAFTSFCRATAYKYKIENLEDIRNAIEENQNHGKSYLISKWIESDNATLNIAAYRLMSTPEEHQKLNQSYVDHTSKGESIGIPTINFTRAKDD